MSLLRDELKGEHAQLLQSTSAAQEKAVAQRELLERTIDRLRGELSKAKTEEETMRKDLECSKDEVYSTVLLFYTMGRVVPRSNTIPPVPSLFGHQLHLVVTKLEDERRSLESQLSEAKVGSARIPSLFI